jgi:ABC-type branched-subunit amino acid transport system substrate-binding protein
VISRRSPSVDGALTTVLVVGAGALVLSLVAISSSPSGTSALGTSAGPGQTATGQTQTNGAVVPGSSTQAGGKAGSGVTGQSSGSTSAALPAGVSCAAGRNGGSTDRGVSGSKINLGATIVSSGIGASFLGPVRIGINAVKDKVNRAGGICGRQLSIKLVDDGWDAQRGYGYIRNLVEGDKVFALAVDPSSEGLRIASNEHYFAKTQTPVVGTDGMLNSQYVDPWVWPVASSTVSTMHIMAYDAYHRLNARHFSIIFDSQYHFGVEGAFAFNAAVKRLTGSDIPGYFKPGSSSSCAGRFCAISAGQSSYSTENQSYNNACFTSTAGQAAASGNCDFVALLLEPTEAETFLRGGFAGNFSAGMGFAQTLFTRDFAQACGSTCNQAHVWTGYNPPVGQFASLPAVATYVKDVHAEDPAADIDNQFLEGGYSGMELVVAALQKVGPLLTRTSLAGVLDAMTFDDGLSTSLQWRQGQHYANVAMQSFSIQYNNGFNGFRPDGVGWVKDPWVGLDTNGGS